MKQTLKQTVDNAIKALNELIICDEFTDPRAVVKVSRFKKWLKEATAEAKTPEPEDKDVDDLGLFAETEQAQDAADNSDNQPTVINFQN